MPYIVVKSNSEELDRRELSGMLVFGRAPECDVAIRDIALSRRHCRIEECDEGWLILDLGSKNGTTVNGELLGSEPRLLDDSDVVRLGRAKIIFHTGLPDEDIGERLMSSGRPADPHEALAGTVSGFQMLEVGQTESHEDLPLPRPSPKEPPTLQRGELQELLTAIASSSWDSIYAEARQPSRRRPMPSQTEDEGSPRRRVSRPRSPIDLSLQASATVEQPTPEPEAIETSSTREEAIADSADLAIGVHPSVPSWRDRFHKLTPESRKQFYGTISFLTGVTLLLAAALGIHHWTRPHVLKTASVLPIEIPHKVQVPNADAVAAAHITPKEKIAPVQQIAAARKNTPLPPEPNLIDLLPAGDLETLGIFEPKRTMRVKPIAVNVDTATITAESLWQSTPWW